MIGYSDEPLKISSNFFKYRNDIDIYTEDEDKDKEFYKRLFSRLLNNKIKINDVTPLGCKENVIKHCKQDNNTQRKKIFIVDGDVKIINESNTSHPNLFVLDRYCIENYLIDENSIFEYIYRKCGRFSMDELKEILNLNNWLIGYTEDLINLFIHFAIIDSYDSNFILKNAFSFHDKKKKYEYNPQKVKDEIEILKSQIINEKSSEYYEDKFNDYHSNWKKDIDNLLKLISGKNYLIPLLQIKCNEISNNNQNDKLEVVKINLVDYCNIENLSALRENILSK